MFDDYFPKVAERETRTITVMPGSYTGLPAGDYGFLEMYCDERGCDCRRVLFSVFSRSGGRLEAVIAWGWEDTDFYAKWLTYSDPSVVAELKGPALNIGSPQGRLAPAILKLVQDVLLVDRDYIERIKRHYQMFRAVVDGPHSPGPRILRVHGRKRRSRPPKQR
jgi:hypothetical protein